ncbi:hypothetical protein ACO0K2_17305 [Undibacterium sp. MH2W]|uniref:hypothetical protein n=1 Tax=Undibacterium sp. MH2W TaxID=3413044 RepID=UPI003BF0109C
MKISDNISHGSFLWQVRIVRVFSGLFLITAIVTQKYFVDLIAFSGISFFASFFMLRRKSNFCLEVYDCKDFLRLKLDQEEITVNFSEMEKVEIRDGKDGLDWIIVYFKFKGPFGKNIQFYPNITNIQMTRLDVWVAEMNERISKSVLSH